jgi:dTDP-4-amino-4,6-dideoxygalactose transaminase
MRPLPSAHIVDGELAIAGGRPVRVEPPPPWPIYESDEIEAVVRTLKSGKVNQWTGQQVISFQRAFADLCGRPHALALANGSLALEAILRAYGIGPGDEVIVTPRSFIASASCVNVVGAEPVFADVDLDSELITPATVEGLIGDRTRAIIVVHLNGRPADMPAFMELAARRGVLVFEDCAQAHGARIHGKHVGSFGHASAFSFCQDKIITTGGEGGMAVFADEKNWKAAWSYRDHGKDYDSVFKSAPWTSYRWLHHSFGSNWRMTEMQAAIGLRQLAKLPGWTAARTATAHRFAEFLEPYPSVHITPVPPGYEHAYYRFEFRLDPNRLRPAWNRDRVMQALGAEGIPCLSGTCAEIYLEEAYATSAPKVKRRPNAAYLGTVSLALPLQPNLDERYLCDCEEALRKVLDTATL